MKEPRFDYCMDKDPDEMDGDEIRACSHKLLDPVEVDKRFDETNKDVLTIVVREDKSGMFDFMDDRTRYKARGSWIDGEGNRIEEDNAVFEAEFLDNSEEEIGKRVLDLLEEYNKKVVNETILYAREHDIEGSTLDWEDEERTRLEEHL